jgi:hypothetical protein
VFGGNKNHINFILFILLGSVDIRALLFNRARITLLVEVLGEIREMIRIRRRSMNHQSLLVLARKGEGQKAQMQL